MGAREVGRPPLSTVYAMAEAKAPPRTHAFSILGPFLEPAGRAGLPRLVCLRPAMSVDHRRSKAQKPTLGAPPQCSWCICSHWHIWPPGPPIGSAAWYLARKPSCQRKIIAGTLVVAAAFSPAVSGGKSVTFLPGKAGGISSGCSSCGAYSKRPLRLSLPTSSACKASHQRGLQPCRQPRPYCPAGRSALRHIPTWNLTAALPAQVRASGVGCGVPVPASSMLACRGIETERLPRSRRKRTL